MLARLPAPGSPPARVACSDLAAFAELLAAARLGLADGQFITSLPRDGSGAARVFVGRLTEDGAARLRAIDDAPRMEARARALCHAQCVSGFLTSADDTDGAFTRCPGHAECEDWQAWLPAAEAGLTPREAAPDDVAP
jgi:hypothetical protein